MTGTHSKLFQPSALVMSAIILLAKANYMVKHRIEHQEMYSTSQWEELQKQMTDGVQTGRGEEGSPYLLQKIMGKIKRNEKHLHALTTIKN